ncbi:MAG TPA: hypothetical protein VM864_16225 [Pyrinomonadaceae bacterium]|jgi:hypothetical protein|nr:hypothetical protein [Pyrinomonadaceae bacterium]
MTGLLTTRPRATRRVIWLSALLIFACALSRPARGQEPVLPPQPAPPPMKYVPDLERAQLASAGGPKERVRATLTLLEARLAGAERHTSAGSFDPAAADLGVYQALLDDVLQFLKPVGRSPDGAKVDSKTRDLYKTIELTLKAHTARIEAMRRATPADYQANVRAAFLYARDKRSEALDAFFGAALMREPRGETKPGGGDPARGSTGEPPPAPKRDPPASPDQP